MIGRNLINNRSLALACIIFLLLVLTACGGGGGGGGSRATLPEPVGDDCGPTGVPENGACRTIAARIDERAPTPFVENGQPLDLEVVLFRPLVDGRHPTVVFHHGSTGNGSDPSRFDRTFTSTSITRFFVQRGWMVVFPQRRGRGQSDGLYDEGFKADRSAYSCREDLSLGGASRALEDLDVITDWVRSRADVDTTQMLVGGVSRGGILSLAHAAQRPDAYLSAINFVGGWLAQGCGDHRSVNRALFVDGATFPGPSLWLYGENDSFYSLTYSRSNFDSFSMAGGLGHMFEFMRAPGLNGHFVINDLELWERDMDEFLAQQ